MLLSPDAALLAFSPGPTHSYRWLITSTSITVASLPWSARSFVPDSLLV
jgi:hypothetical protein